MNTQQQKFNDWLDNIIKTEKPGNNIIAFCFGIYEASDSYEAFLIGSKVFDDKNHNWARDIHFAPKNKYVTLGRNGGDPQLILADLKRYLTDYIQTSNFKDCFLDRSTAIAYGFEKGDLYRLK